MGVEALAVGEKDRRNGGGIDARVSSVESRMTLVESAHEETHRLLQSMLDAVGTAHDKAGQPTGLYALIHAVSQRLTRFETLRERAIGAMIAVGCVVPPTGALVWFLSGAKITKLFGG